MSGAVCQHCGKIHPPETTNCPRTGDSLDEAGPCGSRIDRYFIEELLGHGGFGSVYRAHHVHTEAVVAFKLLKKAVMSGIVLERFMREARAAAAIGDEHVVRIFDADVLADGGAFIVMELLTGQDLKALSWQERPMEPGRAIQIICQALDGLAIAHDKGIVHRDIKPANIFVALKVDKQGRQFEQAKLLDFGISKVSEEAGAKLTAAGMSLGTPAYMPFEQFFSARDVDHRTDLYAMAAILFELLAGRRAYEGHGFAELVNQVREKDAPPLRSFAPRLPVPLCAIIDKGMQREPARRWQSAREFAAALRNAAQLFAQPDTAKQPAHQPGAQKVARGRPGQRDSQHEVATQMKAPLSQQKTVLLEPGSSPDAAKKPGR